MTYFILKSNYRMLRSTDVSIRKFQHNQLGEPLCSKENGIYSLFTIFYAT